METYTISGRLTRDAEMRATTTGKDSLNFSVACNRYKADTKFYNCKIWGARANQLLSLFTKGKMVSVTGEPKQYEYNGKTYEYLDCSIAEPLWNGDKVTEPTEDNSDIDELAGRVFNEPTEQYGTFDDKDIPF